jgi:hypothetical protein
MARKHKSARKKKKTKNPPAPFTATLQTFGLYVELTALEMATGDDGLLRGMPEPVVILAAYLVTEATPERPARSKPLGRLLVRLHPEGRFPLVVAPSESAALKARVRATPNDRIVLLAVALEEDSGKDVEHLYGHLIDASYLRVYEIDAAEPSPVTITELGALPVTTPPLAHRVNVLVDGKDLRDTCKGDEFIGADVALLSPHKSEEVFRAHFLPVDRRNDWTAILAVSIDR